jgi:hypothetical protein
VAVGVEVDRARVAAGFAGGTLVFDGETGGVDVMVKTLATVAEFFVFVAGIFVEVAGRKVFVI